MKDKGKKIKVDYIETLRRKYRDGGPSAWVYALIVIFVAVGALTLITLIAQAAHII